jgi:group I intron endonuclease
MGFIYKITNTINNKVYVGKTERTVEERWAEHLRNVSKYGDRLPLYKAMAKYGKENFAIETIEECDTSNIDDREIYWIAHYGSYGAGYNCTGGGEGGIKDYHEHMDEIIQRYNNGERLDKLCKEFHYDYASFKPKLEAKGIKVDTNAGPKKLSKRVAAIDPNTKEIIAIYESISAAARAICPPGASAKAIGNHISKYKDMPSISHGFYWKTKNTLPNIDEL